MSPAKKYIAECLGTFALVFIGTAVAVLQQKGLILDDGWGAAGLLAISFAFGGTLMVLVWTIGPVSGCHINPAVTIPMAMSGRMPWTDVPGYIIAQIVGAIAASGLLVALLNGLPNYDLAIHGLGANGNPMAMHEGALFGWEVVLTALFLFVIFTATRDGGMEGFDGIGIGGFLFLAHLIGAQLGDSSLNPARSLGPALIIGGESLKLVWVFCAAPVVGGIVGWQLHRLLYSGGKS